MKIGLLIGSRMALPAFFELVKNRSLCGVAISAAAYELEPIVASAIAPLGIPFSKLNRGKELEELPVFIERSIPDVVFVMGFPKKISESILESVTGGFYNFHPGKLPEMRGPDPIFEVVCRGMKSTVFTVIKMDHRLDAGGIVYEQPVELPSGITYGMLSSQAAYAFQSMAVQLSTLLAEGNNINIQPQPTVGVNYWKKREIQDFFIRWHQQSATEIIGLINACNPVLKGAAATINNWRIGILAADIIGKNTIHTEPGTILSVDPPNGMLVSGLHDEILKLKIVYTEEGIVEAHRLKEFGLQAGMRFSS